ncbi:MAG: hypothetical protein AB4426_10400 [Xenococcaceae cyanobacterium]
MRVPSSWELPEQIKKRFGQKSPGKQRAMAAEGHLLLVLHKAPKPDQRERQTVFFWRKPNGDWDYSGRGKGLQPLIKHLEEYSLAEQKFTRKYEKAQKAEDYFQILEEITPLHHATKNLHDTLQSAREAIQDDRDIIDLRDWAYELERSFDLLYMDTKNALDFHIAKKADEQARLSMQSVRAGDRLNTLVAIFLPLTAITSVFGMNLPHGLEDTSTLLFWSVFLMGIFLGFFIRGWVFKEGNR